MPAPPKVFLSYSHDSEEHARRVLELADRLREDGVESVLDQYEDAPPEGWPRGMERHVADADFVLVVATATYKRRASGDEEPGVGRGVSFDDAWNDKGTHVVTVVAWGGVGKTALVKRWLGKMSADRYRGAARVYGWSFYSQGTDEQRVASADQFIDAALRRFGDDDPTAGSARDRGLRLARLVCTKRTLLVLDGVEPLQHPPASVQAGRLKDPALAAFLKSLAASNDGLCVVTTREVVKDVAGFGTLRHLGLEDLRPDDGAELLRHLGVQGTDRELRDTAEEFGGHALALTLLGSYLRKVHGGEVRRRDRVPIGKADVTIQGGHAFRVMAAYERWLGEGPELSILRLMGLFDRPATGPAVQALRSAPAIRRLTDGLLERKRLWRKEPVTEDRWQLALSNLRDNGLLAAPDPTEPGVLDAHPLVRAYFADVLQTRHPQAWRDGNLRLYQHLCESAPDLPATVEEMTPLYAAVVHGCRAGRQQEAFREVYRRRIQRGDEYFTMRKLGAMGSLLTALAGFFDRPWEEPSGNLEASAQAYILNDAGFDLRALGRLTEAVQPMRAGVVGYEAQEDWKAAAITAGNVSELSLTLGDVSGAVASGEESVQLADESGDEFERLKQRGKLANALHQAGRLDESLASFREAEAMQAEWQPAYPRLYSQRGYQYCDLLLGRVPFGLAPSPRVKTRGYLRPSQGDEEAGGACPTPEPGGRKPVAQGVNPGWPDVQEVIERARQTLEWAEQGGLSLLTIALDHLTQGRAHFALALTSPETSDFKSATEHLDRAVDGLRLAGHEDYVARGLLARAALRRVTGDLPGAHADLAEAQEIAERGAMRLHECDVHLQWTLHHLAKDDAPTARRHLERARALVEDTGYGRRQPDVRELAEVLAAFPEDVPEAAAVVEADGEPDVGEPAPASVEADGLAMWEEKLSFLLKEEAVVSSAEQKFEVGQRIEEARRKIAEMTRGG